MMERRSSERIKVNLRGIFYKNGSSALGSRVTNISMSGLFMEIPNYIKLGADILIDIDAENIGQIIGVSGHVVRNTESGVAIEFSQFDEACLERLISTEKYMARKFRPDRVISSGMRL